MSIGPKATTVVPDRHWRSASRFADDVNQASNNAATVIHASGHRPKATTVVPDRHWRSASRLADGVNQASTLLRP
jgi:hypothetical protein